MIETKEKLMPKLRFPEFEDNWKVNKLNNLVRFLDNRRKPIKSAERAKMQGAYPYYGASGIIDYINEYIFDDELILLGEDGENILSRNLPLAFRVDGKCWVNNHAHVLKTNDNVDLNFLVEALEKVNYSIYNTGTAQPKLNKEVCKNIPVKLTSIAEQQKIASFLSAVDEKINQLQRKKELLQAYKKGMMQQLFSQQLRFKPAQSGVDGDANGKDYPEWEEKKLGEISNKVGYGIASSAIEFDGTNQYLRITDIDEHTHKFEPKPLTSPEGNIDSRYYLQEGDLVFARTGASVGKSYLYNKNDGRLIYAGFLIKFSIKNANPKFIFYKTLTSEYNKWVQIMSMRSGQPGLNAEELKSLKIELPCIEEQTKIATFLSALDTKIDTVSTTITQTQDFKKGLLQQMFV